MIKIFETEREEELKEVALFLKEMYPSGGVFLLKAGLGYGKSRLVKEFASLFGLQNDVSSPTFAGMNEYGGKIFHYDFYSFSTSIYFQKSLFNYLDEGGWHFMEWPDEKIEGFLRENGINFVEIEIELNGQNRIYRITDAQAGG